MEKSSLVSIIVPVYNCELYISDCISSILNQTYKNIEVILINDGSTDKSGLICDEFANKDRRIKVFHQKNYGPSAARNTGINISSGEYIQFVDSDDTLENNFTSVLVDAMKQNVQLVVCGYKIVNQYGKHHYTYSTIPTIEGISSLDDYLDNFGVMYKELIINYPFNKLYVAEVIKKFNISFLIDLKMGEDLLFNLDYLKVCDNINIIKEEGYNYIQCNINSLTGSFTNNLFENKKMLFEKVVELLIDKEIYTDNNKFFIESVYTEQIISCLSNIFHSDSNFSSNQRKEEIIKIVYDEWLNNIIQRFNNGNIQQRFVGKLIKYKSIIGIYFYFYSKSIFRNRFSSLFYFLRGVLLK